MARWRRLAPSRIGADHGRNQKCCLEDPCLIREGSVIGEEKAVSVDSVTSTLEQRKDEGR
jgi:hypothetical protein